MNCKLGVVLCDYERWAEAEAVWRCALKQLSGSSQRPDLRFILLAHLTELYLDTSRLEKALEIGLKAQEAAKDVGGVCNTAMRLRLQLLLADIYQAMGREDQEGGWHLVTAQMMQDLDGSLVKFDQRSSISYETRIVSALVERGAAPGMVVERLQPPPTLYTTTLAGGLLFPKLEFKGIVRLLRLLATAQRATGQAAVAAALEADLDETEAIARALIEGTPIEVPSELLILEEEEGDEEEQEQVGDAATAGDEPGTECSICLGGMPGHADGGGLLVCSHAFYKECLAVWRAKCVAEQQPFTCAMCQLRGKGTRRGRRRSRDRTRRRRNLAGSGLVVDKCSV